MPTTKNGPVGPNITVDQLLALLQYARDNPTAPYQELADAMGAGTGGMLSNWHAKSKKDPNSAYGRLFRALRDAGYVGSKGSAQAERQLSETVDAALAKFNLMCECSALKDQASDPACLACMHADSAKEDIMRQNNHSLKERNRIRKDIANVTP